MNMENYFEYLKNKLHISINYCLTIKNEILRKLNVSFF